MSRFGRGLGVLPLALACAVAAAQPVYRCGPDRNVYSQRACVGGTPVEVADPRTETQRAEALALAARERQRAAELAREREKAEKAARPAMAAGIGPAPKPVETAASMPNRRTHRPRARRIVRSNQANATSGASAPNGFPAIVPGGDQRARRAPSVR